MNYEEFLRNLNYVLREYESNNKKEIRSIEELRAYLNRSRLKSKSKGLKSLKGISI